MTDDRVKSQRTIAERAGIRWPSMARRTNRWVLRLPPGSRVRRTLLQRVARIALLSWNRGDFALVPSLDDPEVETRLTVEGLVAVGLDDVYYGPEGHCRVMEVWNEAWPKWDARSTRSSRKARSGPDRRSGLRRRGGKRHQAGGVGRSAIHLPRWTDPARGGRYRSRQSEGPRSHRDLGVGDVAGERGSAIPSR
jgi:hypothetical protein